MNAIPYAELYKLACTNTLGFIHCIGHSYQVHWAKGAVSGAGVTLLPGGIWDGWRHCFGCHNNQEELPVS